MHEVDGASTLQTRPRRATRAIATGLLTATVLAFGGAAAEGRSGTDPLGDPLPDIEEARTQVSLTRVTGGVVAPVAGITAPGAPNRLFVVDQIGILWSVDVGDPAAWPVPTRPVLDVTDLVVGPSRDGDERGFLGAAFSPHRPGVLYTYTSEALDPRAPADYKVPQSTAQCAVILPPDHQSVIREWQVGADGTVDRSAPGQGRRLLAFEQPQFNHNGGDLDFGPDGMLYITSGDGGSGDDQDCQIDFDGRPTFGHPGLGNGQNLGTPLGKILRIDTRTGTGPNGQYGIPADNPFAGTAGALGEIFAYGFRNPFRASFDGATYWVGDVGQNQVEEVDIVVRGGNYGWRLREGGFGFDPFEFDTHGFASDGFVFRQARPANLIDPVAQYDHDDGTAVIGGYVYRGRSMPALAGTYVFGDTSRRINNRHGRIFGFDAARAAAGRSTAIGELRDGPLDGQLLGWGEDANRELYALIMNRDLTSGQVLRVGQAPALTP